MNYYLTFEYSFTNSGLTLKTYWLDLAVDAKLIYLVVAVVIGLKMRNKLKPLNNRKKK